MVRTLLIVKPILQFGMVSNMSKKLISRILILIFSILAVASLTTAWIVQQVRFNTSVEIITEGIGAEESSLVEANLYIGKDFDNNGVLNSWIIDNEVVDLDTKTKQEILTNLYYTQAQTAQRINPAISAGSFVTYRLVLENNSSYTIELNSYFSKLDYVDNEMYTLFKITSISATTYSANDYDTVASGSIAPAKIEVWDLAEDTYYMYDLSYSENFVRDVEVASGDVLELDFKITPISYYEAFTYYSNYYNNYYIHKYEIWIEDRLSAFETAYSSDPNYSNVISEINSITASGSQYLLRDNETSLDNLLATIISELEILSDSETDLDNKKLTTDLIANLTLFKNIDLSSRLSDMLIEINSFSRANSVIGKTFTIPKIYIDCQIITGE